jgi:hypothetical protein
VEINESDLMNIQSIKTIESLSFVDCVFGTVVRIYPPRIKNLRISSSSSGNIGIVEDLPECLECLECFESHNIRLVGSKVSTLPSELLKLGISRLATDPETDELMNLFLNLPLKLIELAISGMPDLRVLPNLTLRSLKSLVLQDCGSLRKISPLPPSLRKLRIDKCGQVDSFYEEDYIEGLNHEYVPELEMNLSSLPPQLTHLNLISKGLMSCVTHLTKRPPFLEEIELNGFTDLKV